MKRFLKKINMLLLLLPVIILSSCAGVQQITSLKTNSDIIIDGQPGEWENQLSYIENEKCAVGFKNDDNYIYLCFETSDNSKIMQILSLGLTVWMEPEEGKTLGVKFPQRMLHDDMQLRQPGMRSKQEFDNAEEMNKRIEQLIIRQSDLSIINEDEFPLYAYPINDPFGFQVHLGYSMGKLVYELRIPYGGNTLAPVIVDAFPGENFKIIFETAKLDRTEMPQRGGGMQAGGGGMSPGGDIGGGRGGMKPPGGQGMSKLADQFVLKLDVVLAK